VVKGWSDAELHQAHAKDAWSVVEILAHVRASDDILAYRAYVILARENPPMAAYDDRIWAEVARYAQTDFHTSLTVFTLRRAELVDMLRHIALDDWKRVGIHEMHGPLSLLNVITTLVEHEEEHCAQLEALLVR
ncbi:MAG: DinB family protein, partial [Chloroflexi bacterium]|nr:DinB family protein [Chloroflexota bacterium]